MARKSFPWLPFTYTVVSLVLLLSFLYGSWGDGLVDAAREAYGHAPQHTWRGDWWRLLTSIFLTSDAMHLLAAVTMSLICVGWLELCRGAFKAILVFFTAHCLALLVVSGLLLATDFSLANRWTRELVMSADIGPSAGYYGCLGACLFSVWRWRSMSPAWLVVGVLATRVAISWRFATSPTTLQADMAHLVALLVGGLIVARSNKGSAVQASSSQTPGLEDNIGGSESA